MKLHLRLPKTITQCEHGRIARLRSVDDSIERELCIDGQGSRMDKKLERTNKFLKNLAFTRAFQQNIVQTVRRVELVGLVLDDWKPFLTTLQRRSNSNVFKLHHCNLTERGALLFGDMLKTTGTTSESFSIKLLHMYQTNGSTAWVDGLLENKTISYLCLHNVPCLDSIIQFIQNSPQLLRADIYNLSRKDGTEVESLDLEFDRDYSMLRITFHRKEKSPSLELCQRIGCLLRRAEKCTTLEFRNLNADLPFDLLKDAIHCNELYLSSCDFDPRTVAFLVNGSGNGVAGKLKSLYLELPKKVLNIQLLLQQIDLSLLDFFRIACWGLIDASYTDEDDQGRKCLKVSLGSGGESATSLASSLVGNNKIEKLEVNTNGQFFNPVEESQETLAKMEEWILRQVRSNWNIQMMKISTPRKFKLRNHNAVEDVLVINKWRKWLCCQNEMPSGVWSPALSRIETADEMFRVVQQVPNLFQHVANEASERDANRIPSFVVPHCADCPGCRKQQAHHKLHKV